MKHRKFFALLLAAALLLIAALPMTASAATGPMFDDGSITITPPGILVLTASDFKAFKLFNVTAITGNDTKGYQFAYEPVQAVKDFLLTLTASAYGVTVPVTDTAVAAEQFRKWLQDNYEETHDEPAIIALAKAMFNSGAFNPASPTKTATADAPNVKFTGVDAGYYLVIGEGRPTEPAPKGQHSKNVISRGMLINVPRLNPKNGELYTGHSKHITLKLKADAPKIDKEVWYHDDTAAKTEEPYNGTDKPANATDPGWQKWTDVSIGDTVYFKHISKVPDMTGYDQYKFIVHDTMSPGLTFNASSVKVYIVPSKASYNAVTDLLPQAGNYTVHTAAPGKAHSACTFEIEFVSTKFVTFTEGYDIIILYEAQLNANAVIGKPGNPNEVYLEYSNNPNDGGTGTGETPKDKVIVYTFDLEIYKYAGTLNVDDYPLDGAEFELSKKTGKSGGKNAYGSAIQFVSLDPAANDGYHYRVARPEDAVKTNKIVISTLNGRIKIKGLDAGEYALTETKAPIGYNLPGFITEIKITHDDDAGGYTVYVGEDPTNTVNIQNNTGSQLPGTGGIGIYTFLGVGAAMAILLGAAYVIYRKKKILGSLKA